MKKKCKTYKEEVKMQNKLERLYNDCIKELKSIKIDITNPLVGDIDIRFSKGNPKRYGGCKHEDPDKDYYHIVRKGKNISIKYDRFKKHHIEISKWVAAVPGVYPAVRQRRVRREPDEGPLAVSAAPL